MAVTCPPDFDRQSQAAGGSSSLVIRPPHFDPPVSATTLHALQEWEGYVLDIGEETFEARLIDLTANATHEGEEATIPLQEISDDDAGKMGVGSIFRWVIGYKRSAAGTKKRVSQIVFRDLPALTKANLRDGQAWAVDMFQSLKP